MRLLSTVLFTGTPSIETSTSRVVPTVSTINRSHCCVCLTTSQLHDSLLFTSQPFLSQELLFRKILHTSRVYANLHHVVVRHCSLARCLLSPPRALAMDVANLLAAITALEKLRTGLTDGLWPIIVGNVPREVMMLLARSYSLVKLILMDSCTDCILTFLFLQSLCSLIKFIEAFTCVWSTQLPLPLHQQLGRTSLGIPSQS